MRGGLVKAGLMSPIRYMYAYLILYYTQANDGNFPCETLYDTILALEAKREIAWVSVNLFYFAFFRFSSRRLVDYVLLS